MTIGLAGFTREVEVLHRGRLEYCTNRHLSRATSRAITLQLCLCRELSLSHQRRMCLEQSWEPGSRLVDRRFRLELVGLPFPSLLLCLLLHVLPHQRQSLSAFLSLQCPCLVLPLQQK